ncbi:sugar ABC transporter substrate-binding protein [Bacillus sp. FJAT-49711]|uniref:ABC transporter substrate-binding protein n=1 Tax=Bacillus sp. FJAT-49711 TaxID=2833585 RepID=UPI001BCA008C|nr:sugar ABC transporter substrate-binding protein [Bacillus sp. FJAT-49711]MBS4220441.1 sugar ABC transporter substrate-binding protein [Bacillus sp. FJAT-49711]
MKKYLSIIVVLLFMFLSGCSGDGKTTGGGGKSKSGDVTLTYAIWDANQAPALQQIADKFTEENPNIKVKVEVTPWDQYWTKLETAATGGSLPDLFWLNASNIQKYAKGKVLLPITEQADLDKVDLSKYPEALVNIYTVDNELYAFPKDFDTIGLWYNKELFDNAGLEYPNENWTWDDLIENAKKLTDEGNGIWGFASPLAGQTGIYNTVYQAGGYILNDDLTHAGHADEKTLKGIKFMYDMIHTHKVSPTVAQMTDTPAASLFESGKVAMLFEGSWMQVEFAKNEYTKDKVDVTALPAGEKDAVVIHGLGNVIAKNTKYPEEAWKFSKFLGSEQAHKIQAETGTVIPAYQGTQDAWVQSNPNFNLQVFIDMTQDSVPYPVSIETRKWQQIETEILTQAWAGNKSLEDAAKEVAEKVDEVLAEEKK